MSAGLRQDTWFSPFLDLLRTTLAEHAEVTLRAVRADSEHAEAGYVDACDRVIGLPDNPDDVAYLTRLVLGLYTLDAGGEDPRLHESARWFAEDATRRTLAAMGEVAR